MAAFPYVLMPPVAVAVFFGVLWLIGHQSYVAVYGRRLEVYGEVPPIGFGFAREDPPCLPCIFESRVLADCLPWKGPRDVWPAPGWGYRVVGICAHEDKERVVVLSDGGQRFALRYRLYGWRIEAEQPVDLVPIPPQPRPILPSDRRG